MGAIMICTRCGYSKIDGVPGMGLGYEAGRLADEFFKGKKPSPEVRHNKVVQIYKRLEAKHLKAQREAQKGHEICPARSIVDIILFRESKNKHNFRCWGVTD